LAGQPTLVGADRVLLGIGLAVAANFLFSLQDATVKWLVAGYSPPQILFMRSLIIVPFCLAFGGRRVIRQAIASPVRRQLLWRSLVILAAWFAYFTAARDLPLAELVTIYFSSPLLVAALAVPLLGERITAARGISLALGFLGVVIACRPASLLNGRLEELAPIGLALVASALWAYTAILIRQIVRAESTLVLVLVSNIVFLVCCTAAMPFLWQSPAPADLALMLLVGLVGTAGQFLSMESIRHAPATVVAPISFSSLVWGFCLGLAIWGDMPGPAVVLGAALILLSGLLVTAGEWLTASLARGKPRR
jgi:drug/metabolite transporter (DMT)-like permease